MTTSDTTSEPSNLERAREAWGAEAPEWVLRLAHACDASSQAEVARRLELSKSAVSKLLARRYPAETERIARRILSMLAPVPKQAPRSQLRSARDHWGDPLPEWVEAAARACDQSSQAEVARRLGISATTLSLVLQCKPWGRPEPVIERVRGELLGAHVACPVLGEINRRECVHHQTRRNWRAHLFDVQLAERCPRCEHRLQYLQQQTRETNHEA